MFERYAIYYTAQGAFASHGAAWLGWDINAAKTVAPPVVGDLDLASLTETPRKYGFHGTIKAPFRLAEGHNENTLLAHAKHLADQLSPVSAKGLKVVALGRFLALIPQGEVAALNALAGQVVRQLDTFRAPPLSEELARRRKANLSPQQEENLKRWGYPHVMDQFRFHITLTSRLPRSQIANIQQSARAYFAPVLPQPFVLDALTIAGQRPDGMFVTLKRFVL